MFYYVHLETSNSKCVFSYVPGASPLIKINQITQLPAGGSLNRDSKVQVKFTSTSAYADKDLKASLAVNVQKHVRFFGYVPIPSFVFRIIAPAIEKVIPGVKYTGGKFN